MQSRGTVYPLAINQIDVRQLSEDSSRRRATVITVSHDATGYDSRIGGRSEGRDEVIIRSTSGMDCTYGEPGRSQDIRAPRRPWPGPRRWWISRRTTQVERVCILPRMVTGKVMSGS